MIMIAAAVAAALRISGFLHLISPLFRGRRLRRSETVRRQYSGYQ
jgi:hypothetical protein